MTAFLSHLCMTPMLAIVVLGVHDAGDLLPEVLLVRTLPELHSVRLLLLLNLTGLLLEVEGLVESLDRAQLLQSELCELSLLLDSIHAQRNRSRQRPGVFFDMETLLKVHWKYRPRATLLDFERLHQTAVEKETDLWLQQFARLHFGTPDKQPVPKVHQRNSGTDATSTYQSSIQYTHQQDLEQL